jgi:hypothetical protein
VPNDRTWLRDSALTGVSRSVRAVSLLNWSFNAWASNQLAGRRAGLGGSPARQRRTSNRPARTTARMVPRAAIETNGAAR